MLHLFRVSISCNTHCIEINTKKLNLPIAVAASSKAWVCGCLLAGIVGSNPVVGMDVSFERCALSGRDLYDGLIPCPEDSLSVIMSKVTLHLQE
jgi:hypothetical protein